MTRPWLSATAQAREAEIREAVPPDPAAVAALVEGLAIRSRTIHEVECVNLNPATNVMNPRAEALLSAGLGSRPSLGHPGEKYEMGLEAIEQIEVVAADLAAQVMGARYAEIRVPSGAIANLYAFMATCNPGDAIIVPPPEIGGHVTHQQPGAAGLYGLEIHLAPVDAERYTVDVPALAALADRIRPRLITLGGSLNLLPHPVAEVAAVAHDVGASLLFDAAHACGMIAGRRWPNPLAQGADVMTMSTYKSLGGPPGGLVLTDDVDLAARIDSIAYPGLTANFDVATSAALAIGLVDWVEGGPAYAAAMVDTAVALGVALAAEGLPVATTPDGVTRSHQLAIDVTDRGGGQTVARHLRRANVLTSGIGLPAGDGLRLGTPEAVRWGMEPADMPELAALIARGFGSDPERVAGDVTDFRGRFRTLHHIRH